MIIEIDDATVYWLEDPMGERVSPGSPSSADPLASALVAFDAGRSPDDLVLVCRLADGERYEVGGGVELLDASLAAAGRPRLLRPVAGRSAAG